MFKDSEPGYTIFILFYFLSYPVKDSIDIELSFPSSLYPAILSRVFDKI